MNFLDNGTDEVYYEHINRTILYGNFMNKSLIIIEGNYAPIIAYYSIFRGYYILIYSSYPYTLQVGGELIKNKYYVGNSDFFKF